MFQNHGKTRLEPISVTLRTGVLLQPATAVPWSWMRVGTTFLHGSLTRQHATVSTSSDTFSSTWEEKLKLTSCKSRMASMAEAGGRLTSNAEAYPKEVMHSFRSMCMCGTARVSSLCILRTHILSGAHLKRLSKPVRIAPMSMSKSLLERGECLPALLACDSPRRDHVY